MNTALFKVIRRKLWLLAIVASFATLSAVEVAFACQGNGGGC